VLRSSQSTAPVQKDTRHERVRSPPSSAWPAWPPGWARGWTGRPWPDPGRACGGSATCGRSGTPGGPRTCVTSRPARPRRIAGPAWRRAGAIDLAGVTGGQRRPEASGLTLDRAALAAYRRRLVELADDIANAELNDDIGRAGRARDEREWIVAELRRSTRPGGAARTLGVTTAERARKAVTARIRDAIHRITEVMPDLGAHLDRSVRTGNICRYDP
jgi:hypothetical protein